MIFFLFFFFFSKQAFCSEIKVFREWWWFRFRKPYGHNLFISFSEIWQQCHPFVQYDQRTSTSKSRSCILPLIHNNSTRSEELWTVLFLWGILRTLDLLGKGGTARPGRCWSSNPRHSAVHKAMSCSCVTAIETQSGIWSELKSRLLGETCCSQFSSFCSCCKKRNWVLSWSLK